MTLDLFKPASNKELRVRGYTWFKKLNVVFCLSTECCWKWEFLNVSRDIGCGRFVQLGLLCVGWYKGKCRRVHWMK